MYLKKGNGLQHGKYRINQVLGQGGFGITYLATQELLDRQVCIKEFFFKDSCSRMPSGEVTLGTAGNKDIVERFINKFVKEARTLSQLEHPNIIRVLDIFMENNTAYYVMDFIDGSSLEDIVKRKGALSEADAVNYIKQVAAALDYIHQRNVNHLDVKPANIMIRKSDNKAILIDFGVSKQYDSSGDQTSTTPVGISYGYAPMEQYRPGGVGTFSPPADIYALGATLYKLVTGNTPPQAMEILNEGLTGLPQSLSSNIATAIRQAMQLKKMDRPQSIKDFLSIFNHQNQNVSYLSEQHPTSSSVFKPTTQHNGDTTIVIKPAPTMGKINGYSYVDLGLPSGIKWATCNIGANKPEEQGYYYAWGEINPKAKYNEGNYEHIKLGKKLFNVFKTEILLDNSIDYDKYENIGINISGSKYDAAKYNWGGSWRMPTEDECEELSNKCRWLLTSKNGKSGYQVTGPNGNSIFLPANGWRIGALLRDAESSGGYWAGNQGNGTTYAFCLHFNKNQHHVNLSDRDHGYGIRPVSC